MAGTKSPTFLFIPGGWHLPDYFAPITKSLAESGYESATVRLNVNADPPLEDLEPEVNSVLERLKPLLDGGKDVIVVSHSYGGIPATEAVGRVMKEGSGIAPGKIVRLVYLTAFVPAKGDSMVSMIGEFEEQLAPNMIEFTPPYTTVTEAGYEILYHDVPQPYRSELEPLLGKHSVAAGVSPATNPGWRYVPSTFIHATKDRCVLPSMQAHMVKKARAVTGRQRGAWTQEDGKAPPLPFDGEMGEFFIEAGHTAHVSQVEAVKAVLVKLAEASGS